MRYVRLLAIATLAAIAACKQEGRGEQAAARLDAAYQTSSDGEVALAEGGTLRFSVTSEQFRKWDAASAGIDKSIQARFGDILHPEAPSERTIDAAVKYLESQPTARSSIERAGLSVRQFVVTTVALEQEMRVASGRGSREPDPDSVMMPMDTLAMTPYPPVVMPYTPPPLYPPIDSSTRRVDTVYVQPGDTARARSTYSPWDSLVQRGTMITGRDSVQRIRDSIVSSIMKRDSIRKAALKRDSVIKRTYRPLDSLWRDTTAKRDTVRRDTLATARDSLPLH